MEHQTEYPVHRPVRAHPVWWVVAISLAVIAVNLTIRRDNSNMVESALAQSVHSAGARGIFAFTGQMTPTSYGVYMVDVDNGTIWSYELVTGAKGVKKLKLVAARSWIFDRYLEEYNLEELTPRDVEAMVEEQRSRAHAKGAASNP